MSILRCHAIVALPLHPTSSTKIQAVWCSISHPSASNDPTWAQSDPLASSVAPCKQHNMICRLHLRLCCLFWCTKESQLSNKSGPEAAWRRRSCAHVVLLHIALGLLL